MENENTKSTNKKNSVADILKKYGYYIAVAVLVVMLALAIVLTSISAGSKPSAKPTGAQTISFGSPILNGTISKGYSNTELQYNKALNVWEIHKGLDYTADVGTDVLAVYDGTVTSITTNLLLGTVVEIDHGNGLKTTYGSLEQTTPVKVGDVVKKGDVIGKASNTATSETSSAGEVHFEVWKDGSIVDPASFLDISSGR